VTRFAIARVQARGIPVFVDPKAKPFRHYRGATCVTPNLAELALASRMPIGSEAEVIAASDARPLSLEARRSLKLSSRRKPGPTFQRLARRISGYRLSPVRQWKEAPTGAIV